MEMSPFALVSMAWQHEDETLDPVKADRLSEDMRVRCEGASERGRTGHSTAPHGLIIETTGHMLETSHRG